MFVEVVLKDAPISSHKVLFGFMQATGLLQLAIVYPANNEVCLKYFFVFLHHHRGGGGDREKQTKEQHASSPKFTSPSLASKDCRKSERFLRTFDLFSQHHSRSVLSLLFFSRVQIHKINFFSHNNFLFYVSEVPNVQMNEIKKNRTFHAGFLQNLTSS